MNCREYACAVCSPTHPRGAENRSHLRTSCLSLLYFVFLSHTASHSFSFCLSVFRHPHRQSCYWTTHDQPGIISLSPYTILDKHSLAVKLMKLLTVMDNAGGALMSQMWILSTVKLGSAMSSWNAQYLSPYASRRPHLRPLRSIQLRAKLLFPNLCLI